MSPYTYKHITAITSHNKDGDRLFPFLSDKNVDISRPLSRPRGICASNMGEPPKAAKEASRPYSTQRRQYKS